MTGVSMKPPKDVIYVSVECNSFIKSPRQIKGCLLMIYIQEHLSDSEEIIKDSMFQWVLVVMKTSMSSCMIGFYVYKSLALYNGFLETVHINNQRILHFVNIWSKEVIVNVSYPRTVNQIYGYMDAIISPTLVRYIISRYRGVN